MSVSTPSLRPDPSPRRRSGMPLPTKMQAAIAAAFLGVLGTVGWEKTAERQQQQEREALALRRSQWEQDPEGLYRTHYLSRLANLESALAACPEDAGILTAVANTALKLDDAEKILEYGRRLTQADPYTARLFMARAHLLRAEKEHAGGSSVDYAKAAQLICQNRMECEHICMAAYCLLRAGNTEESRLLYCQPGYASGLLRVIDTLRPSRHPDASADDHEIAFFLYQRRRYEALIQMRQALEEAFCSR